MIRRRNDRAERLDADRLYTVLRLCYNAHVVFLPG